MKKIKAISDTHLGIKEAEKAQVMDFLNHIEEDVDALVLNGDIHDLWRRDMTGCVYSNSDFIQKIKSIGENREVYYVTGNHDNHFNKLKPELYMTDFKKDLKLKSGNKWVKFMHGDEFDHTQNDTFSDILTKSNDYNGETLDQVWCEYQSGKGFFRILLDLITGKMEKEREQFYRMDRATQVYMPGKPGELDYKAMDHLKKSNSDRLVYGHTHDPFISDDGKLGNTGSWVKNGNPYDTFIEVDDGELSLKQYMGKGKARKLDKVYDFKARKVA